MSDDVSVDELVDLIKNPTGGTGEMKGACVFAQTIARLPAPYQQALEMTVNDRNVRHPDIVAFINNNTEESVTLSAVQRHRNKRGCSVCLYGSGR